MGDVCVRVPVYKCAYACVCMCARVYSCMCALVYTYVCDFELANFVLLVMMICIFLHGRDGEDENHNRSDGYTDNQNQN